jgi:hypothetical protein
MITCARVPTGQCNGGFAKTDLEGKDIWLTERDGWQSEPDIMKKVPLPRVFCGTCGDAFEEYSKKMKAEKDAKRLAVQSSANNSKTGSGALKVSQHSSPVIKDLSQSTSIPKKKSDIVSPTRVLDFASSKSTSESRTSLVASNAKPSSTVDTGKGSKRVPNVSKVVPKSERNAPPPPPPKLSSSQLSSKPMNLEKDPFTTTAYSKKIGDPWKFEATKKRGIGVSGSGETIIEPEHSSSGQRPSRSRKQCHQCSSINTSTWWVLENVKADYIKYSSTGQKKSTTTVNEPQWKGYSSYQVSGDTEVTCDECHLKDIKNSLLDDDKSSGKKRKNDEASTKKTKRQKEEEEDQGHTNNLAEIESEEDDEEEVEEVEDIEDIVQEVAPKPSKKKSESVKIEKTDKKISSTKIEKTTTLSSSKTKKLVVPVATDDKEEEEVEEEEEEEVEEEEVVEEVLGRSRVTRECAHCYVKRDVSSWWIFGVPKHSKKKEKCWQSFSAASAPMKDVFCEKCKLLISTVVS